MQTRHNENENEKKAAKSDEYCEEKRVKRVFSFEIARLELVGIEFFQKNY